MAKRVIEARVNVRVEFDPDITSPNEFGGREDFVQDVLRDLDGDIQLSGEPNEWVQISFPGGSESDGRHIEILEESDGQ